MIGHTQQSHYCIEDEQLSKKLGILDGQKYLMRTTEVS